MKKMASHSTKTNAVKKLVRNTEINVQRKSRPPERSLPNICFDVKTREADDKTSLQAKSKYLEPELLTAKTIVKKIKAVEELSPNVLSVLDIHEKNKVVIDKQVAKMMNFHFDEKIYTDLVALNMSDTLKSQGVKSRPNHKSIPVGQRDIEPDLQDFYTQENQLDSPIVVSSVKVKCYPTIKYNGLDFYQKFRAWDR